MKKYLFGIFSLLLLLSPFIVFGADWDSEDIASASGIALNTTVQSVIQTALDFITTNLPLIAVFGVAIGLVFWLLRKAVRAIRGRG